MKRCLMSDCKNPSLSGSSLCKDHQAEADKHVDKLVSYLPAGPVMQFAPEAEAPNVGKTQQVDSTWLAQLRKEYLEFGEANTLLRQQVADVTDERDQAKALVTKYEADVLKLIDQNQGFKAKAEAAVDCSEGNYKEVLKLRRKLRKAKAAKAVMVLMVCGITPYEHKQNR